jgi:hypothetical protein
LLITHTYTLIYTFSKPIPTKVTKDQSKKLDKNEPVLFTEQSGKSGRGVVIQDINATQAICTHFNIHSLTISLII